MICIWYNICIYTHGPNTSHLTHKKMAARRFLYSQRSPNKKYLLFASRRVLCVACVFVFVMWIESARISCYVCITILAHKGFSSCWSAYLNTRRFKHNTRTITHSHNDSLDWNSQVNTTSLYALIWIITLSNPSRTQKTHTISLSLSLSPFSWLEHPLHLVLILVDDGSIRWAYVYELWPLLILFNHFHLYLPPLLMPFSPSLLHTQTTPIGFTDDARVRSVRYTLRSAFSFSFPLSLIQTALGCSVNTIWFVSPVIFSMKHT